MHFNAKSKMEKKERERGHLNKETGEGVTVKSSSFFAISQLFINKQTLWEVKVISIYCTDSLTPPPSLSHTQATKVNACYFCVSMHKQEIKQLSSL